MKRWIVAILLLVVACSAWADAAKLTLAQIKQAQPESFLTWARAFLGVGAGGHMAYELQILILAAFVIPLCQVSSFWFKWAGKMVPRETSLIDYFYRQDPQRTAYAFLAAFVTIASGCFTNAFSTDSAEFVGWYNVLYNLVIVGTGGDLLINKGGRQSS